MSRDGVKPIRGNTYIGHAIEKVCEVFGAIFESQKCSKPTHSNTNNLLNERGPWRPVNEQFKAFSFDDIC